MEPLPTIVIHGYLANALTNLPIHLTLRRHGIETHDVPIPGLNTINVEEGSRILAHKVAQVLDRSGVHKVNLVGVSKGGVIALHYLRHLDGHRCVHTAITVGSPLRGTPFVTPFRRLPHVGKRAQELTPDSPLMERLHRQTHALEQARIISIYADGDLVVSRESATIPEAKVVKAPRGTWPFGHYQLVIDPRNLQFIAAELTNQQFETINLTG